MHNTSQFCDDERIQVNNFKHRDEQFAKLFRNL